MWGRRLQSSDTKSTMKVGRLVKLEKKKELVKMDSANFHTFANPTCNSSAIQKAISLYATINVKLVKCWNSCRAGISWYISNLAKLLLRSRSGGKLLNHLTIFPKLQLKISNFLPLSSSIILFVTAKIHKVKLESFDNTSDDKSSPKVS